MADLEAELATVRAARDVLVLQNEALGNALVDTEAERDTLRAELRELRVERDTAWELAARKRDDEREARAERDTLRDAQELASSAFAHQVNGQTAKAARLIEASRRLAREALGGVSGRQGEPT